MLETTHAPTPGLCAGPVPLWGKERWAFARDHAAPSNSMANRNDEGEEPTSRAIQIPFPLDFYGSIGRQWGEWNVFEPTKGTRECSRHFSLSKGMFRKGRT